MSATIDSKLFADYFAYELLGQLQAAPVLSVEGHMYSVKEHYLDDIRNLVPGVSCQGIEPDLISFYGTTLCRPVTSRIVTWRGWEGRGSTPKSKFHDLWELKRDEKGCSSHVSKVSVTQDAQSQNLEILEQQKCLPWLCHVEYLSWAGLDREELCTGALSYEQRNSQCAGHQ